MAVEVIHRLLVAPTRARSSVAAGLLESTLSDTRRLASSRRRVDALASLAKLFGEALGLPAPRPGLLFRTGQFGFGPRVAIEWDDEGSLAIARGRTSKVRTTSSMRERGTELV